MKRTTSTMLVQAFLLVVVTALVLGESRSAGATPAFVNGTFEGGLTGWTAVTTIPVNTFVHVETCCGPGFDGLAWLFLCGFDCQGYAEQTVSGLTSGTTYAVDFLMASELNRSDTLVVSVTNGSSTPSKQFFAPAATIIHWDNWASREYDFLASGTSATVRFSSVASLPGIPFDQQPHYDVGLDKVSLEAIPEPASLLLLLAGLLALRFSKSHRD